MTGLLLLRVGRFYNFPSVYLEHWAPSNTKPRQHEFQTTWDPGYPGSGTTGFYQYPNFRQHTSPSSSLWTEKSCNPCEKLCKNQNKLQLQLNQGTAKKCLLWGALLSWWPAACVTCWEERDLSWGVPLERTAACTFLSSKDSSGMMPSPSLCWPLKTWGVLFPTLR